MKPYRAGGLHQHNVTLVCGPPLGGKSTYVREHSTPGDLIIDTDAIGAALSGLPVHEHPDSIKPFLWAVRDAVLAQLQGDFSRKQVWVIETAPDPDLRQRLRSKWSAGEVVVLLTPAAVCRERLLANPRRTSVDWNGAIELWWKTYRPSDGERTV